MICKHQKYCFFYSKRDHEDSKYFEWYRCYGLNQQVMFSARAISFGKPISVFKGEDTQQPIAELRNSKGYLINGKTHFQDLQIGNFFGYYTAPERCWMELIIQLGAGKIHEVGKNSLRAISSMELPM